MQNDNNERIFKKSVITILEDNEWEIKPLTPDASWKEFINETGTDFSQDVWEAVFIVHVSKELGGDKEQTWAEIRSIPGVTIVTPFGHSIEDSTGTSVRLRVKFCCISQVELTPRIYVQKVLKSQMKTIVGLTINKLIGVNKLI